MISYNHPQKPSTRDEMQDGVACNASLAELVRDESVMCSSIADHVITQVCAMKYVERRSLHKYTKRRGVVSFYYVNAPIALLL